MSGWTLTRTRLAAGIWEGVLTGGTGAPPALTARHQGREIAPPVVTEREGVLNVRLDLPSDVISDGVQTIVITERDSDTVLDSLVLLAGDALVDDVRAEVDLLRAELDMLKRAFRRHCVETA